MKYSRVLINKNISDLDRAFIYRVPARLREKIAVGTVVDVPFGPRNEKGIVIAPVRKPYDIDVREINGISKADFSFPADLLTLAFELSNYYFDTTISMLKAMIPGGVNLFGEAVKPKYVNYLVVDEEKLVEEDFNTARRRELLAFLRETEKGEASYAEIRDAGFNATMITSIAKCRGVEKRSRAVRRYQYAQSGSAEKNIPYFTGEQQRAFNAIVRRDADDHRPILVHGVTGSGKTELYLRLIRETINKGKQAIVLLPEIALTPQFVAIFEERFGGDVALFHSRLSKGERRDAWYAMFNGVTHIALGARSCIFAPARDLGLIIVDEEHEESYEQDNYPRFHAVKAAELRAEITGCDLILGSATPSFESYAKAQSGEYMKVTLKRRVFATPLPAISTVDMRSELKDGWMQVLSRELIREIQVTLIRQKQVILFLNRLGYQTFVSCRDCGFVYRCPECGVALTYYKRDRQLRCTRCQFRREVDDQCPECHSPRLRYFGLGVEQLEEVVRRYFPGAKVDRLDSDSVRRRSDLDEIYRRMQSGETDILIGTAMVAKGWDFPNVALTGIIAADYTLNFPDFRAGERTFRIVAQVAGRSGRGREQGKVVLQTYRPEEPALLLAGIQDYDSYFRWEENNRRRFGYPPFTHMVKVIFSFQSEFFSEKKIAEAASYFKEKGFRRFGPTPAIYREPNYERWVLTYLGDDLEPIRAMIRSGMRELYQCKNLNKGLSLKVAIDPVHPV